ncbi:MAG: coenzyme F420-0:L-glutamate ligase [Candidatus Dormibacteria bacterium]
MGRPLQLPLSGAPPRQAGIAIVPVGGIPEVRGGDDLAGVLIGALETTGPTPVDGDVVVVASKVVSKALGRAIGEMPPAGERARELASATGFDADFVELILSESREVLRARPNVLVVETRHGFVCANAGIDRSNTGKGGVALLLPEDSDGAARELRGRIAERFGVEVAVLISDTFGRPFRNGLVNVAIGGSGIRPIRDYRGQADPQGHILEGTELAVADELCAAAELVMNKLDRVPLAIIRGYQWEAGDGSVRPLLRDPAHDYFR